MAILAYTDIISLTEAKTYLRIDDSNNPDDSFIISCINASLQWIEKYTNHILIDTDKKYYSGNESNSTREHTYTVYDYPIVSVLSPISATDYKQIVFDTKNQFITKTSSIELNLGYTNVSDIPESIVQAALSIIQVWYYNSEKMQSDTLVPNSVRFALNPYRRFPLF